jgi:hypothetical protein
MNRGRRIVARAAAAALIAVAIALGGLLAGCGTATPARPATGQLPTARPTTSAAVAATLQRLDSAARASGLGLAPALAEIRPAEPPSFAAVPRWPFQALLPEDPSGGYFVIYEFPDPAGAAAGGRDLAAYVASGPGRVQYPPDVRFVLRQVGSTLVYYPWSPASSPDPRTPDLAAALASVGTEVPIYRG